MGLGIEIREQSLDREGLGSLVWYGSKIQVKQKYRLRVPVFQRHIATRKFLKLPPPPTPLFLPLGERTSFNCYDGDLDLDSWLVSFISSHHWKWIYNLTLWQQTKSWHQNQRVYCLTCRGKCLCWFERYSFSVLLRYYKHLPLATTLALVGESYNMIV